MIGSLWNGISGVSTYTQAINAESNDMANVNTIAHKESDVKFEDMLYSNGVSNGIGHGVNIQEVNKNFSQGGIKQTDVQYDVALNGDGFFVAVNPIDKQTFYTRAGNFRMGENGNLLTSDNLQIQGVIPNPVKTTGSAGITLFDENVSEFLLRKNILTNKENISLNANTSDYKKSAADFGASGDNYKTKNSILTDIEGLISDYKKQLDLYSSNPDEPSSASVSQKTQVNFNTLKQNLQAENDFVSINVDGDIIRQNFTKDANTTMNLFSDKLSQLVNIDSKIDANGVLNLSSTIPGKIVKFTDPVINELSPVIIDTQKAQVGSGRAAFDSSSSALQTVLQRAGAKFLQMENSISNANEQNLQMSNINLKLNSLGISNAEFSQLEITDGNVYLKDGQNKFLVGRIAAVRFSDNNGLKSVGDNNFTMTAESGEPRHAGDGTSIISSSLELSTSNVGENLTELLVLQKAFESNSKVITTSDEFLKTAINLKR